jgi:hypothetical protein
VRGKEREEEFVLWYKIEIRGLEGGLAAITGSRGKRDEQKSSFVPTLSSYFP